ncbi:hypothetical protein PYCCODRAFT_1376304 [Trametes coccinea BRFM310]|uniref:BTB domain-containing protein n=1 Tax=Trametes coccinea (strain BRFM310) TaxID=1353009 RepID=A0A1Y2IAW6_TRAC3|nr:hypothetical protein PYCCODRAFT_1376304 [Trametes coccinea BRFM310]
MPADKSKTRKQRSSDAGTSRSSLKSLGSSAGTPFKQDADFWFEDGSLIIVAAKTGFCIHKSVLARLSPVFGDLFLVAEPDDVSASGLPVVEVSDSADDFKYLLHMAYDGRKYLQDMEPHIPFAVLSAVMRMGDKYEIEDFVDEPARYLGHRFLTDFQDFWAYLRRQLIPVFDFSDTPAADMIEVVQLARLTGRYSLLPLALYACCQLEIDEIVGGVKRATGETVCLSREDAVRCLRAREELTKRHFSLLPTLRLADFADECPFADEDGSCRGLLANLEDETERCVFSALPTDALVYPHDYLAYLTESVFVKDLCDYCQARVIGPIVSRHRLVWRELLDILDLSPGKLGFTLTGGECPPTCQCGGCHRGTISSA